MKTLYKITISFKDASTEVVKNVSEYGWHQMGTYFYYVCKPTIDDMAAKTIIRWIDSDLIDSVDLERIETFESNKELNTYMDNQN